MRVRGSSLLFPKFLHSHGPSEHRRGKSHRIMLSSIVLEDARNNFLTCAVSAVWDESDSLAVGKIIRVYLKLSSRRV